MMTHSMIINGTINQIIERVYLGNYIYIAYNVQYGFKFRRKIEKLVIERIPPDERDFLIESEIRNGYIIAFRRYKKNQL